jgi:hypothetical protein
MEKAEVHGLLVQISHIDQRIVDAGMVHMWWEIIGHYSYADARAAVPLCFMESDSYMTPNRLVERVKKIRNDRAVEENKAIIYDPNGVPAPNNFAEMTQFYTQLYKDYPWADGDTPETVARELGREIPAPVWEGDN